MLDALLLEHLLEAGLTSPGHELTSVVREDLAGSAPLTDRSLQHFEYRGGCLLPEQTPAGHEPTVIVDQTDQVDPVHPLQLEGEDIGLPHRVGQRSFEAAHLGWTTVRHRWLIAQACIVDRRADLLGADLQTFVSAQLVPDAANTVLRVILPVLQES